MRKKSRVGSGYRFSIAIVALLVAAGFLVPASASAECKKVGAACNGEACPNVYDENGTMISGVCKMAGSGCSCEYVSRGDQCKPDNKGNCKGRCPRLYKMKDASGNVKNPLPTGECRSGDPCSCFYYLKM